MATRSILPRAFCAFAMALLSWQAQAAVFTIDTFQVWRNSSLIFDDPFSDGAAPPSAPNFNNATPASYTSVGTFGPESGGLLQIDTAQGVLATNAAGAARRSLRAALDTNTSNAEADLGRGLKDDDKLMLRGIFNLGVPVGPQLNGFAIRYSDRAPGYLQQAADLNVLFNPTTGAAELRWLLQDFAAGTTTPFGSALLTAPLDADQILLQIDNLESTDNKTFRASWAYLKNGFVSGAGNFGSGIGLFNGERYVRAEFLAFEDAAVVPLPGTLWLAGTGLLAGLMVRRRQRA
jgi:hypothetical protein